MAMVIAAHRSGGLGFLATGYKTPESVQAELDAIREVSIPFGVNVFVPNPMPIQPERSPPVSSGNFRRPARWWQRPLPPEVKP